MEFVLKPVQRAGRRLVRAPVFAFAAVATLAMGIGATSAIFALVNGVLLRPLPYPESERLVAIGHAAPGLDIAEAGLSDGTYLHYRRHSRVFDDMGVYLENAVSVTDGDQPERVQTAMVAPSVLSMLRITPALGRPFRPSDVEPGGRAVVLISHDLWVRRYGADPGIVGSTIELNRSPREVIGIMPPAFAFPRPETQVWYGMSVEATKAGLRELHLAAIGRLKPGVSIEEAQADLQRLIPSLMAAYPDVTRDFIANAGLRTVVTSLKDAIIRDVRSVLWILLCAVGMMLLIAWVNLANLFLVRAERQQKEVAIERALGALRGHIALRFLGESLLLAAIGSLLGLLFAYAGIEMRLGFEALSIPRIRDVRMDGVVVLFTLGLGITSVLLLAGVSLLRVDRSDVMAALSGSMAGVAAGRQWQKAQSTLVVLQVAVSLVLLVGSALMVLSAWQLRELDLGFDARQALTFELHPPYVLYPTYQDATRFHHQLLDQLHSVPGVEMAEATLLLPLTPTPSYFRAPLAVEGRPVANDELLPTIALNFATSGYFDAMRIPLVRGRGFQADDLIREPHPVVLSTALARRLFRREDPIGEQVRIGGDSNSASYTVVGIAGDTPGEAIADGPQEVLYFPILHDPRIDTESPFPLIPREATVVVRTSLVPTSVVAAARRVLRELDPKVPISRIRTMEEIVAGSTARVDLTMLLLVLATVATLFMGFVGLYGVVAYSARRRVPEFGIRIAMGARPAHICWMVLRQGALLALIGIGMGLMAAFALTRFLRRLLYDVSPTDPVVFAIMAAVVLAIAVGASYMPARRAGRIDPVEALRAE